MCAESRIFCDFMVVKNCKDLHVNSVIDDVLLVYHPVT